MTQATQQLPAASLLQLIWLASPALPVGGFSYSEVFEAAVDRAGVATENMASDWLADQLHLTLARGDLPVIANAIAAESDSTTVISLGGDLAVAGPGGWPVAITETVDDPAGAEIVHLPYGGLATSSTAARRWMRGGVIRHHLLDPLTGEPTRGPWRTVTATGATCLAANTASTAAVVLGEAAVGWLTERDIPARLVDTQGKIVRTARWPEPEVTS